MSNEECGDLDERKHWDEYQDAFENMIQHTSTEWAPWWVVPADHKYVTRALVAGIITRAIDDLGVAFPEVSEEKRQRFGAAKADLLADGVKPKGKKKKKKDAEVATEEEER